MIVSRVVFAAQDQGAAGGGAGCGVARMHHVAQLQRGGRVNTRVVDLRAVGPIPQSICVNLRFRDLAPRVSPSRPATPTRHSARDPRGW
eukprot:363366-Chlamydomonas_euryale.AAC.8